ncbi:MAG TPA: hydrogenase nickel incorporation protein HypB [Bryobacteraceae bacterium]|nr:hydrogenase nickel incorporation protein HypB [Bryobacteraceae bacterium]
MTKVEVQQKVLSENQRIARSLRDAIHEHGIYCANFISSPGAGKTLLLERTLASFPPAARVAVLTGDIQTDNDAQRLVRYGFPVRQISTGGCCHLDARMVERALEGWDLAALNYLFIENVGNLVCPASYDLGEHDKIVILSTTEGEDKPLKYPATFSRAGLVILNKIDLLPYVSFDVNVARENIRKVHPGAEILELSATTGAGFPQWEQWLERRRAACAQSAAALALS